MKIYVACPMNSSGQYTSNIRKGIEVADDLANMGHIVYCPALTHFWDLLRPHPYEFWMKQDFAWVQECDALFRVPGESKGADLETELAKSMHKIIFTDIKEVPQA